GDGRADLAHQCQIEVQVVQRGQSHAEHLVAAVQVAQVRARIATAGGTGALGVDGSGVLAVHRIADVDDSGAGEQMTVARVTGGHHTVEQVHSTGHCGHDVLGITYAHQIA